MTKFTKDNLISEIIELNKQTIIAFQELKGAINELNEQGRLHTRCLEKNTAKLDDNSDSIKSLIELNKWLYRILIILLAIVAVAAGAEQILKLGLF